MRIDRHAAAVGTNVQSGAYAVVADADDRVLILRAGNGRFYLPGGRVEPGETPQQALAREILEECGCEAQIGARLGGAVQPILAGSVLLRASYWRVEIGADVSNDGEYLMLWTPRAEAAARLHRPGDAQAVLAADASVSRPTREPLAA